MVLNMMLRTLTSVVVALATFSLAGAQAAEHESILKDRRIGYVTSTMFWSVYQTADGKTECPQGLNGYGPREVFSALYPNLGSVTQTQLAREGLKAFPQDKQNQFPYLDAKGSVSIGMNLDGKVGTDDFTSPDGQKGIDNKMYRVLGCNAQFRGPEGQIWLFANKYNQTFSFNRTLIEITEVDSIENDDAVEVTIYRGREPLLLGPTGEEAAPGGTQHVDLHYGKTLVQHLRGKIAGGVLTTEPMDARIPWAITNITPAILKFRDMRFQLDLTAKSARGLIAGYVDVDSFYHWTNSWSSHHLAYGQLDAAEFYWAVKRNADAYPDASGAMTAISSSIDITMAQVFVVHDEPKATVADAGGDATRSSTER